MSLILFLNYSNVLLQNVIYIVTDFLPETKTHNDHIMNTAYTLSSVWLQNISKLSIQYWAEQQ